MTGELRLTLGVFSPSFGSVKRGKSTLPRLGELELAVLEHLWSAKEADVAATHAAVGKRRGITPNTVGSALERLFKKGLLRRRKVSHAFRYTPALDRDELAARRLLEAAGGFAALTRAGLLSAFVDLVADVDEEALDRLEALIAEKRQDREGE
jgi:predicted transcriptional regulator